MIALRVYLVFTLVLLFPMIVRAETFSIGTVVDIHGPATLARVIRGQDSFPPEVGLCICQGDRISVTSPGTSVTVELIDRPERLVIDKVNSTDFGLMTIKTEQTTLTNNVLQWLAGVTSAKQAQRVPLNMRGQAPALVVPIFRPHDQTITTGLRDWSVAWHGGDAPYHIRLSHKQNAAILVQKTNLAQPSVVLERVNPTPGGYLLEVSSGGRRAAQSLIVVDKYSLPDMPKEIQNLKTTDNLRTLLYITWLSKQDHGKWLFEAMLQANQISRTYPPASRLLRSLQENCASD